MDGADEEDCFSPISCVNSVFDGPIDDHSETPATSPSSSPCKLSIEAYTSIAGVVQEGDLKGSEDEIEFDRHADFDGDLAASSEASISRASCPPGRFQQNSYGVQEAFGQLHNNRLIRPSTTTKPRSSRLHKFSIDYPDRFIPARSATSTKQALLLSQSPTPITHQSPLTKQGDRDDPFSPSVRRSARISERYAVLRAPLDTSRQAGQVPSNISNSQRHIAVVARTSDSTISWTVNGQSVTEGVASTTNSRGGRITSGSNAPHFCADLLRLTEKDQGHELHERRLALAMDIDQRSRIISPGWQLDCAPAHAGVNQLHENLTTTIWKDCRWQATTFHAGNAAGLPSAEKVPTIPFRVLDAPTLRDDFYCSLLAYCPVLDCLAVGLANHVYIWSEKGRRSNGLPESLVSQHNHHHITSLSFSSPGHGKSILAIGRSDGLLSLWHPLDKQPRFSNKHPVPISFVSFRPSIARRASVRDPQMMVDTEELLVGDDLGSLLLYSLEWPSQDQCDLFDWTRSFTLRAVLTCHTQQICGIAWSANGEQFATGGNDNRLFVFDHASVDRFGRATDCLSRIHTPAQRLLARTGLDSFAITPGQVKQSFLLNAAVKAIAFAPWQSDLLAAGGGSNDRCVHFFHIRSGARLATINCHAQVTSVIWNTQRRELAVTLGFAQPKHSFRVAVFAWPSCDLLASIPWAGEERALYALPFPGGPLGRRDTQRQTLVIATSDASIKFHEVWPKRKVRNKRAGVGAESQILNDTCSEQLEEEGMIR